MTGFSRPMCALFFVLAAAAAAQNDFLQRGVELFREGNYAEALLQFQAARQMRPNDAQLENIIGITETKLSRIEEANNDYAIAARLDPKLSEPHKNLAFNYLQAGQYTSAETELKVAVSLNNSDPTIHYYFILVYLSTSRDHEVASNISAAEPLLQNDPETAFFAAKAALNAGQPTQAKQLIELLEDGRGFSLQQEYDLAKALSDKGMHPDSAQRFRYVLKTHPESWESKYNLAMALLKAKQNGEASSLLSSLMSEHANDANVLSAVASAAESAGNSALALKTLEGAVAADLHNPDRYLDCTRLLMDLNRYEDAAQLVKEGMQQVPDTYPLMIRLGAIEMMRGEHSKAIGDYQQAIDAHPEVALGYVALAQVYMKDGNDQEALKILSEGRGRAPADFALEYAFGLASVKLGRQDQAVEALHRAAELNAEVVEPHYQLGLIYMQQEQLKKAQEEFESVLRINQSSAPTYFQLSRLYARTGDKVKSQQMAAKAKELNQAQQEDAINGEKSRLSSFHPQ